MSKSSSSLLKGNKLVEESHMKTLRELSALPDNRHCFECSQRGPTYVDVTIGSFICMTCSGLLRGLTPPHRVKSISMATFTSDELQLLKSRGNEYCRKVWLATYTQRDSHLTSEQDSDRRNALKSHMSAKYEQKRYWVDPSKLPELLEIQASTAKALSSSTSSSIGSGSGTSGSGMQKSPSLSSSSGSSLSLSQPQQNQGQGPNQPSPILNNLRNHTNHQPSRLVNSVTLPDIKPLSGLLGSIQLHSGPSNSNSSTNSNGHTMSMSNGSPAPINFINNLSTNPTGTSGEEKIINRNPVKDPWGGSAGVDPNPNFANFEEAFNGFNANFGEFKADFGQNGFGNLDQKPLVPMSNGNELMRETRGGGGGGGEDRYAALKDLDELLKHNEEPCPKSSGPLPSSASVPVNLSSSGWFSESNPNQPNPFSQVAASPPTANGANGTTNGWSGTHNPFFSQTPSWGNNSASGLFGPSHSSPNNNLFATTMTSNVKFNPFAATTTSNPHNPFL